MEGETDDADAAADRLEAALERLAALTGTLRAAQEADDSLPLQANSTAVEEIAGRLDDLIAKLHTALGGRA